MMPNKAFAPIGNQINRQQSARKAQVKEYPQNKTPEAWPIPQRSPLPQARVGDLAANGSDCGEMIRPGKHMDQARNKSSQDNNSHLSFPQLTPAGEFRRMFLSLVPVSTLF